MAQEEILEDMEKETHILPKKELEEVNLGTDPGNPKLVFIKSQLSAQERSNWWSY